MSQKNMGRLAQDMKREVIAIIGRLKDPRLEGGLLTVTRLDVTPDLDVAKVYVSVMGRSCAHRGEQKNAHPQGAPVYLCRG